MPRIPSQIRQGSRNVAAEEGKAIPLRVAIVPPNEA